MEQRALPILLACAVAMGLGAALYVGCGGAGTIDLLPIGPDAGDGAGDVAAGGDGRDCGACPCGLSSCGGTCVDLSNDPQNCGSCSKGCNHGAYCSAAICTCLPGNTQCAGGTCSDINSNPDTCGSCTTACTTGQSCETGCHSAGGTCPSGLTACPASNGRFECVDLDASIPFCGSCGTVCGPAQICAGGSCQTYLPATPCSACPCACDALVGAPSSCCPGIGGGVQPICVHGASCP